MARAKENAGNGRPAGRAHYAMQTEEAIWRKPQLKRGRWRVYRRDRGTGEVTMRTLLAETFTEARDELAELVQAERERLKEQRKPPEERTVIETKLLGEALDEWLRTLDVRPATRQEYAACAAHYKKTLGKLKPVALITARDIEQLFFVTWAKRKGRTKIKHKGLLSRFWAWCMKHRYARENVIALLEVPKRWGREARDAIEEVGQALTAEEAKALLAACKDTYQVNRFPGEERETLVDQKPPEYLWLFVFLSLRTGLRRRNLLSGDKVTLATGRQRTPAITWGDLDLESGILSLPRECMKSGRPLTVPLHAEAVEVLRQVRAKSGRHAPSRPVVQPVKHARKAFGNALKRAKLADRSFRLHDLRHTAISWFDAHCPRAVSRDLAGHSRGRTMTDRYSHVAIEEAGKWLNKLPRLLDGKTSGIAADGTGT